MSHEKVQQAIKRAGQDAFFTGKASEVRIKEIEKSLGVLLPNSYKWFLKELGHGGVSGVEILGNGLGNVPVCQKATLNWRKYGLPTYMVVIEDEGTDWIYCLDTSKFKNNECPVVDWEQNRGVGNKYYEDFFDFLSARIEESLIDN